MVINVGGKKVRSLTYGVTVTHPSIYPQSSLFLDKRNCTVVSFVHCGQFETVVGNFLAHPDTLLGKLFLSGQQPEVRSLTFGPLVHILRSIYRVQNGDIFFFVS